MKEESIPAVIAKALRERPIMVANGIDAFAQDEGARDGEVSADPETRVGAALSSLGVCAVVSGGATTAKSRAGRTIACDTEIVINFVETPGVNRRRHNWISARAAAIHSAGWLNLRPVADPATEETLLPVFTRLVSTVFPDGSLATRITFTAQSTIEPQEN